MSSSFSDKPTITKSASRIDKDEEDDGDDEFEEYTAGDKKLFYNPKTREVRLPSDNKAVVKDDDEKGDEKKRDEIFSKKDDIFIGEKKGDREDEEVLPTDSRRKQEDEVEDQKTMTIDKVVRSLAVIDKHVSLILDRSTNLSPEVIENLRAIVKNVESVQKFLESKEAVDDRDNVDGLIDYPLVPWDFDNQLCDSYRATVLAKFPHSRFRFNDWHFPQYFSVIPLPDALPADLPITIRIPEDGKPSKKIETKFNQKDTVLTVLKKLKSTVGLTANVEESCLKAFGLREFMDLPHLMISFEYIRQSLRDSKPIEVVFVRKPEPLPPMKEDQELLDKYRLKAQKADAPLYLQPHEFQNLPVPPLTSWENVKQIPFSSLNFPFGVRVAGLEDVDKDTLPRLEDVNSLFVEIFLIHGMTVLENFTMTTTQQEVSSNPRFMEWLKYPAKHEINWNRLPRETRVCFIVSGKEPEKEKAPPQRLGWATLNLIDEYGQMLHGKVNIRLWPFPSLHKKKGHGKVRDLSYEPAFYVRNTTRDNHSIKRVDRNIIKRACVLQVHFPEFPMPVVAPLYEDVKEISQGIVGGEVNIKDLPKHERELREKFISADALFEMNDEYRALVWKIRHSLVTKPSLLTKFLQSVKWGNPDCKAEAYRLLDLWAPPTDNLTAMELVDARYADYRVREYAVRILRRLSDEELRLYLLQLVQAVKFEPYHDSPLKRFLMERAFRNPITVGHHFFWHLKSEMHNPPYAERFGLLLEEYLSHNAYAAKLLRNQNGAVNKLQRVAELIVTLKRDQGYSDADAMKEYTREIEKLNRDMFVPMGQFQIPFNPKQEATTLILEKCRYMSSKMVPLWLVFKNADAEAPPLYIIFKSGDDLRQDILTLQMLRVMDYVWLQNGLDMRMKPYSVIATGVNDNGEGVGMIEVVLNSDTTSGIQLKYGGGAMGALKLDPIERFIKEHNGSSMDKYNQAVDNFVRSCAGYCVATYILGIGDRHNGNIMVTKAGHLFHIDFGHFLGNFKKKFGVNRERAAFVFTPEMAYVMGGKNYKKSELFTKFKDLSYSSFKLLRKNGHMFEMLFVNMVAAGMPELLVDRDIEYMAKKLDLVSDENKAIKTLDSEIQKSLDSTYRRIDNMIHNLRHG